MRRKFWALLMTIMMLATMVPAAAFAGTESQTAYFYIWKPGTAEGTNYVDAWYYAGTGSVKGLPQAKATKSRYYNYSKYVSEYPETYPDIKGTDGHIYTYDKDGTGALYTYTIDWAYVVDAPGANNGSDVITNDPAYHVDGYAVLKSPHMVTVDFKVKQPEAPNYVSLEKWPQVYKQGDAVTAPSVDSVVEFGGEEYMFDGWYLDAECTEKAEADDFTVMKNTIFYGKYERLYTVSYEIEGPVPGGDANKPALTETKKYVAGATVTVADAAEAPSGYKFSGWTTEDAVIGEDGTFVMPARNVVLKGSFSIDENQTKTLTATVDYDLGGTVEEDAHIDLKATVQVLDPDTLSTEGVAAREFPGWELKSITVNGETVEELPAAVGNGATIVFHYEKVMAEVSYTVKHVTVNGEEKIEQDSQTYTGTAWVNDKVIEVEAGSLDKHEYTGYKYDSISPEGVAEGAAVADGTVITLYYVKDETAVKEMKYTVQHAIEGSVQDGYTSTYTEPVWVNDPDEIAVQAGSLEAVEFTGYKLDSIEPAVSEGEKVDNETVITLNYVRDNSQTKTVTYTVNHIIEGEVADTESYEDTVWVNEENPTITVVEGSVDPNEYAGYEYLSTDPDVAAGEAVADGTVINITYKALPDETDDPSDNGGSDSGDKNDNGSGVKTGDDFNIWIFAGIALAAVLVALATVLTRRHRQK